MSKWPDMRRPAIVGAGEDQRETVVDCVRRKCEGCRAPIYLSRAVLAAALSQARAIDLKAVLLCWKCAGPWLDDIARRGGGVASFDEKTAMRAHDEIIQRRDTQIRSN